MQAKKKRKPHTAARRSPPGLSVRDVVARYPDEVTAADVRDALTSGALVGVHIGGSVGWRVSESNAATWITERRERLLVALERGDSAAFKKGGGV